MDFMEILDLLDSSSLDLGMFSNFAKNAGSSIIINNVLVVLLGITLTVFAYLIPCYVRMFQGRKAGLKSDWFAYVPVVASIYKMDMIREDRWKIVFVGGVSSFIKFFMIVALVLLMGAPVAVFVIFDLLVVVYFIVCMVFCYLYNRKFFAVFNYNAELALIGVARDIAFLALVLTCLGGVWGLSFLGTVVMPILGLANLYFLIVDFNIAFNNRVRTGEVSSLSGEKQGDIPAPATIDGQIRCVAGMYKDAVFTLENNFEIIIGRDSYYASVVINEGAETISRKHCGIRYDLSSRSYFVTDYSTNGTFTSTGERLQRNVPRSFPAGTVICLGDKKNRFKLV